jgi:hypothetical protein
MLSKKTEMQHATCNMHATPRAASNTRSYRSPRQHSQRRLAPPVLSAKTIIVRVCVRASERPGGRRSAVGLRASVRTLAFGLRACVLARACALGRAAGDGRGWSEGALPQATDVKSFFAISIAVSSCGKRHVTGRRDALACCVRARWGPSRELLQYRSSATRAQAPKPTGPTLLDRTHRNALEAMFCCLSSSLVYGWRGLNRRAKLHSWF